MSEEQLSRPGTQTTVAASIPAKVRLAQESETEPVLTWPRKLLYCIGDVSNAIKTVVFTLFTLYFYTTVMGVSATLVGVVAGIGLVWDGAIDPYIGYWSDRVQTRWGRRHPFMLIGAVTMGASLWLFLAPPLGMSILALFVWMTVTSLLVRTSTSIFLIPYFALGAELSGDYHERTAISGIRAGFAMLGTLLTSSLSFALFFPDQGNGIDPKLNYAGYPAMGMALGSVMTGLALLTTFSTLRFGIHLQNQDRHLQSERPATYFATFRQLLKNRSFLTFFLSFSCYFWGIVTALALSVHYLTYYAEITSSTALSAFQAAFYISGSLSILVWLALAKRVDKKKLYIFAAGTLILILLGAYFLLGEGRVFGVGNVRAALIGHALAGPFASIVWFLPWSMMADIADEDELQTGMRREGSIIGIFFLGQQLASGLSIIIVGALLEWYAGLVAGQAVQTAETAHRIGVLFGIVPAIFIGLAALIGLRYRLDKTRVAQIQDALQQQRQVWASEA